MVCLFVCLLQVKPRKPPRRSNIRKVQFSKQFNCDGIADPMDSALHASSSSLLMSLLEVESSYHDHAELTTDTHIVANSLVMMAGQGSQAASDLCSTDTDLVNNIKSSLGHHPEGDISDLGLCEAHHSHPADCHIQAGWHETAYANVLSLTGDCLCLCVSQSWFYRRLHR